MFSSEFRFYLRDIPTEITFRLYRPLHYGDLIVRRSQHLVIPQVAAPPPEPVDENDKSEGAALHAAVDDLVRLYNAARAQGLTPSASWLTPNAQFC